MMMKNVSNYWRSATLFATVLMIAATLQSATAQQIDAARWKGTVDFVSFNPVSFNPVSYNPGEPQAQGQGYGYPGYDQGRPGSGYWLSDARPSQRDFGGGSGGRNVTDAKCGPGAVATGFHVQMGQYFNLVWVDCAGLKSNGSLDNNIRTTSRAGAQGGAEIRDARCPWGQGMVGLRGSAAASIDEAVGQCANPRDIADGRGYPLIQSTNSITIPRPGGRPSQAQCQSGQVMVGIRVKSGQWIDHMWILCSVIQRGR